MQAIKFLKSMLDKVFQISGKIFNFFLDKKFTCPYCMWQCSIKDVLYVCPVCGSSTNPGTHVHGPVKCSTPGCGGIATIRRCPNANCSENIPVSMLETRNLPFSIVGVASSGKTNYITVMLNELAKSSALRLSLSPANQETREIQERNRHNIYDINTPAEGTEGGYHTPQIWNIKNLMKRTRNTVPTYTFTIFDGAGEDYENELDPSSTVCRYISTSRAILIALDPLILPGVRKVVSQDALRASRGDSGEGKDSAYVVNRLAEYIKSAWGVKTGKLLEVPAAIILTKFDMLLNHSAFASNALVKNPGLAIDSTGHINKTEFMQVDQEIRDWLYAIDEANFINAVTSHFKEYLFFGVSSFGCAPDSRKHLAYIKPHRVLDPIMWLFMKEGFID